MDQEKDSRPRDKRSHDPTKPYNRPKSLMDQVSKITSFISPSFLLRMVTPGRGSPHDGPSNQPSLAQTRNDAMQRDYMSSGPPLPDMMNAPAMPSFMVPPGAEGASPPDHVNLAAQATPFSHYKPPHQTPTANGKLSSSCDNEGSFLWSPQPVARHNGPQPAAHIQKPGFQLSAFGTPHLTPSNSGLPKDNYHQSPFYPGKIAFGGAAAHRKSRLASASPYESSPGRRRVKAKPAQNASLSGVSSSTAKLILDTLERMTTPISDAKKIPAYPSRAADSPLSFTPGQYRRKTSFLSSSNQSSGGPPNQQLNCSRQASLATNHYRAASPVHATPSLQTSQHQSEISETKTQDSSQSNPVSIGGGGKMRRERGGHHYSSRGQEEEQPELPPMSLSTSFKLPLFEKPLLDLAPTMAPPTSSAKQPVSQPTPFSIAAAGQPHQHQLNAPNGMDLFKFSSPINKASESVTSPVLQTNKDFQFSRPLGVEEGASPVQVKLQTPMCQFADTSSQGFTFGSPKTKPKLRPTSQQPVVPNGSSGGSLGLLGPAAQLKTGSVMDILGKGSATSVGTGFKLGMGSSASAFSAGSGSFPSAGKGSCSGSGTSTAQLLLGSGAETAATSSAGFGSLFKKPAGSWECPSCMISNKSEVKRCVACDTAQPAKKPLTTSVPAALPIGSGFGAQFQKPAGNWECSTCLVSNKCDASRCVACDTSKPAEKPPPTSMPASQPLMSGFGSQFKTPAGSWECPTCMISNKAETAKCLACDTAKPAEKPSVSAASTQFQPIGSGFGSQFTPAAGSWECPTCWVKNKSDVTKCVSCTSSKPAEKPPASSAPGPESAGSGFGSLFQKAEGSWECPTCMITNKSEIAKCLACDTAKPGQKPALASTPMSAGSGFGSLFQKAEGSWECPTCMITNKSEIAKCLACDTAKPGQKPALASTPMLSASSTPSPKPGVMWTCDTCLVQNKPEAIKCIACEASKPGAKPTTGFTSSRGFKFTSLPKTSSGISSPFSSAPSQSSGSQSGFQLGTKTPPGGSGTPQTGFRISTLELAKPTGPAPFGTFTAPASSSTPSVGFRLGASSGSDSTKDTVNTTVSAELKNKETSSGAASVGGFTFGVPASSKPAQPSAAAAPTSAGGPAPLGGTGSGLSSVTGDAAPAGLSRAAPPAYSSVFGKTAAVKQESLPSSGFVFGATKTDKPSPFGIPSRPSEKTEAVPSTTFTFGQKTESSSSTTASAVQFSFGQKATSVATPGKAAESHKPASAAPMFNFQPANQAPAFSAPASSLSTSGMFKRGGADKSDADEDGPAKKKPSFTFGSAGSSSSAATGGFKFGTTESVANASNPATFTFSGNTSNSSNTSSTPATGFVFGQATSKPLGASEPTAPKPAETAPLENKGNFSFGQPSGGLFQFSANSQNTSTPSGNAGFNFSSQVASAPAPTSGTFSSQGASGPAPAGFNFSASATPQFSFGGGAPQQPVFGSPAPAGMAAPPAGAFQFSAGGTGSTPQPSQRRQIKRAVRKLRK